MAEKHPLGNVSAIIGYAVEQRKRQDGVLCSLILHFCDVL